MILTQIEHVFYHSSVQTPHEGFPMAAFKCLTIQTINNNNTKTYTITKKQNQTRNVELEPQASAHIFERKIEILAWVAGECTVSRNKASSA